VDPNSSEARQHVQDTVSDYIGIDLTPAQVDEILADPYVRSMVTIDFDTVARETIAQFLGRKITGKPWPLNGTPQDEKDAFWTSFEQNLEVRGYKKRQS
jgi:hypothetical protein